MANLFAKTVKKAKQHNIFVLEENGQWQFFSRISGKYICRWSSYQKTIFLKTKQVSGIKTALDAVSYIINKNLMEPN